MFVNSRLISKMRRKKNDEEINGKKLLINTWSVREKGAMDNKSKVLNSVAKTLQLTGY